MMVILPRKEVEFSYFIQNQLEIKHIQEIQQDFKFSYNTLQEVSVYLPKFKIEG